MSSDHLRTTLITGANAGIGRAAARQLAAAGHQILLGCRDLGRGEEAAAAIRAAVAHAAVAVLEIDMASQASIRAAAATIDSVDVVIHNAAAFDISQKQRLLTAEGHERIWATNHLGPVLLTELLLPKLLASPSPRIIAVTSKGLVVYPRLQIRLDDVDFTQRPFRVASAYYQSKLAQLAWMLDLRERLSSTPAQVHGVRVTNVQIDLARYPGLPWFLRSMYALKSRFSISPDEMAKTYTWLATADAGAFENHCYWDAPSRPATPTKWATDAIHRRALMALTRSQLGLAPEPSLLAKS